jgi:hypothetical protein
MFSVEQSGAMWLQTLMVKQQYEKAIPYFYEVVVVRMAAVLSRTEERDKW